jgi:DNA-binding GntR family transcriptional regulator
MRTEPPPASAGFSSIQATDLVAVVEAQLQEAILDGRIAPGDRIVEAELARQMGISRAPVREAARRLESVGLLVSRPRHGFAVRQFTARQVEDLYQVRIELELMGATLACQHASDAQLAALLAQVDDMVARAGSLGRAQRVAEDLAFHHRVCALSGNAYLLRLFLNLSHEVQLILALTEDSYGDPAQLANTHRPIALALAARDAAAARAALRFHLDDAVLHVRGLFAKRTAGPAHQLAGQSGAAAG